MKSSGKGNDGWIPPPVKGAGGKSSWPSAASVRKAGGGPSAGKVFSAFGVQVPSGPGQYKAAKLKARALAGSEGVPAKPNITGHAVRGGLHQSTIEVAWKRIRLTRFRESFSDLSDTAKAALENAVDGEGGYIDYSYPPFSNAELSIYSRVQRANNRRVVAPPGISPASYAVEVLYSLQCKAEFRKKFTYQLLALRDELKGLGLDPTKIYAQEWKLWGIILTPDRALEGTFSKLFVEWTAAPQIWDKLYTTKISMPGGAHLSSDPDASAAYLSGGVVAANEPELIGRKRRRLISPPPRSVDSGRSHHLAGAPGGTPAPHLNQASDRDTFGSRAGPPATKVPGDAEMKE